MKINKRFIITEIYQNDMHAVDKVLVDTQTHVQYLLHLEGSSSSCSVLVDAQGKPLLCENLTPHPDSIYVKKEIPEEVDQINERKENEPLEKLRRVKIRKSRRKDDKKDKINRK